MGRLGPGLCYAGPRGLVSALTPTQQRARRVVSSRLRGASRPVLAQSVTRNHTASALPSPLLAPFALKRRARRHASLPPPARARQTMDGGGPKTNIENNEVARNSIWREHVRKEDSLYRAPAPFRVDPKTIRPMPEKPNRTDPNTAHQVGREDVPLSLRETVPSRTTRPQPPPRAPDGPQQRRHHHRGGDAQIQRDVRRDELGEPRAARHVVAGAARARDDRRARARG